MTVLVYVNNYLYTALSVPAGLTTADRIQFDIALKAVVARVLVAQGHSKVDITTIYVESDIEDFDIRRGLVPATKAGMDDFFHGGKS